MTTSDVGVIDLFCGAGGLSCGLKLAGLKTLAGIDIDEACRHPFEFNLNAPFEAYDILSLGPLDLVKLFGSSSIRVLAGCAPCQPYSHFTRGGDQIANRAALVKFGELARDVRPDVVIMENVPKVQDSREYRTFLDVLSSSGYHISTSVVQCAEYGMPQRRRRLVFLASVKGPIRLLPYTGGMSTVRETIMHLPPLAAGESCSSDPLHKAARLSELNLERIRHSTPGGSWSDWPDELVLECHRRDTGRSFGCVYGRIDPDSQSPTITTKFTSYGTGRFGHPYQDRALSLREGALLQTFPADYEFVPKGSPVGLVETARMIGNAVPVQLGQIIGKTILSHCKGALPATNADGLRCRA